jgi:hypothetical protein
VTTRHRAAGLTEGRTDGKHQTNYGALIYRVFYQGMRTAMHPTAVPNRFWRQTIPLHGLLQDAWCLTFENRRLSHSIVERVSNEMKEAVGPRTMVVPRSEDVERISEINIRKGGRE